MNKTNAMQELDLDSLLETGLNVRIKIDINDNPELKLPDHLMHRRYFRIEIGYNMGLQDLEIDDDTGISCTLLFGKKYYWCNIPWQCVIGYSGQAVECLLNTESNTSSDLVTASHDKKSHKDADGKVIRPPWLRVIK